MDTEGPAGEEHRPGADVLRSLHRSCRLILHERARFDDRYLGSLDQLLPPGHPLRESQASAFDLLDVALGAVLSDGGPELAEAGLADGGERCAAAGIPDDAFPAVGRAIARAAPGRVG